MGKYVTIVDIAKRLGMSHSTVSRALNNHPRISQVTKERVRAVADELGYWPNDAASGFKKGMSKLIGVIIPDLSTPFFSIILENLQKTLSKSGYSVLLFNTRESFRIEIEAIRKCLNNRVEGILAAITKETSESKHYKEIIKQGVPLVFFDRVINSLPVPKVVIDDYHASFKVNEYLLKSGCKRIAHITGTINLNNSNKRLYGYLDALTNNGFEVNEELVFYYRFKPSSIEQFIKKILRQYPDLDGISVFNDYVAYHTIEALQKNGKKVPQDVSVFGFSDEPIASYTKPQLSSVEQVAPKIGKKAAKKMITILSENKQISNEQIEISPKLILRKSTR